MPIHIFGILMCVDFVSYLKNTFNLGLILTNLCTEKSLRFYSFYIHWVLMEIEYLARWALHLCWFLSLKNWKKQLYILRGFSLEFLCFFTQPPFTHFSLVSYTVNSYNYWEVNIACAEKETVFFSRPGELVKIFVTLASLQEVHTQKNENLKLKFDRIVTPSRQPTFFVQV